MTQATLSAATVKQLFPAGTVDTDFTYTVTGTLATGAAFSLSQTSGTFDLAPGTYTGVVSKFGVNSGTSVALVIVDATQVSLDVPDASTLAIFTSP